MLQINGAVDAMEAERKSLQIDIESYKQRLTSALSDLDQERKTSSQLRDKLLSSATSAVGISICYRQ